MRETKPAILLHQRSHVDADADRYLTGRNTVVANGITQAIVQFAEQPRRIYGNIAVLVEPGRGPRGWGSSGFARLKRENGRHPRQQQSQSGGEIGGAPFGQSHAVLSRRENLRTSEQARRPEEHGGGKEWVGRGRN